HRLQLPCISLEGAQVECRTSPMTGNDVRESVDPDFSEIPSFGIHPEHAVGKMHGGKCRHQQVADVSHIGINKINRLFNHISLPGEGNLNIKGNQHKQENVFFHIAYFFNLTFLPVLLLFLAASRISTTSRLFSREDKSAGITLVPPLTAAAKKVNASS